MRVRKTSRAKDRMMIGHHSRGWILRARTRPVRVTAITQAYLKGEKVAQAPGAALPLECPLGEAPERSARLR
jgi:hypothetical protein